ncbi:MAG: Uma2 family endonuclease [Desulfotomaculales bacterium]
MVLKIASELRAFVRERHLGEVFVASVPVRLWPGKIRKPDVFLVAREHLDRLGDQVCGVPGLVVEVTSPATERADRIEKSSEYARAGVREYWLVDPAAATVEVFVLERGLCMLAARGTFEERVASRLLPGFAVTVVET